MVVVTGQNKASGRPSAGGAMSSSEAEEDFQEPATPTATQPQHPLPLLPQQFPEVVALNVGGVPFATRLSTLRRHEDTMLWAMFSGRHYIPTDAEGRYFIDRDGTYFGDVLNFLRSGDLPPRERVRSVYKEAQYYSIGPLLESLEELQPLKGEKVRQAFLGLMPYYKDHLEHILEIGKFRLVQCKAIIIIIIMEKLTQYKDLKIELQRLWHKPVKVVPVVIGTLGHPGVPWATSLQTANSLTTEATCSFSSRS
nr:BTB/POZ domain-containing protein KCTD7 isoform X2 [Anolis sagrei ordinatus]